LVTFVEYNQAIFISKAEFRKNCVHLLDLLGTTRVCAVYEVKKKVGILELLQG